MQPDARGRRPTGKDSHEMVVQVHQNPNWDGAGTIPGPGEAYSQSLLGELLRKLPEHVPTVANQ